MAKQTIIRGEKFGEGFEKVNSMMTEVYLGLAGKMGNPTGTPDGSKFLKDDGSWGNVDGIVLDTSPAADLTGSGDIASMTVDANTYGISSALHLDTDGNFIEANATSDTTMPCSALALETGTGTKKVLFRGVIRNDAWDWTPGVPVFMSTSVGALTATAPSTTGNQVQIVGITLTADTIYFNPSFNLVEIA